MDELQSGPLMVKSLMGRCFVVELWLRGPMLVCDPNYFRHEMRAEI
jgi:hypothetical protein